MSGARPTVEVFLDTNAIAAFLRDDAAVPRSKLEEAVESGSIRVLGSVDLLEEIARIANRDPQDYLRFAALFWRLVGPYVLIPTAQRILQESRVRGALEGNCRFLPWTSCQELRRRLSFPAFAAEVGDAVYEKVIETKASTVVRRQGVLDAIRSDLPGIKPSQLSSEYWSEPEARVDDWMMDYMRSSRGLLGLSDDETTWPLPRELPTAWRMHAYLLTRMVLTVGLGRQINDGDLHDSHHFASAACGDVFVSDDKALHETLGRAPLVAVRVATVAQFSTQILEP